MKHALLFLVALSFFTTHTSIAKVDPGFVQDVPASKQYKFYENGGDGEMTPSQLIGREIWMKATAGNSKFHTYVLGQRIGFYTDWYAVLRTDERYDNDESKTNRFKKWGLINDPECCTPGEPGCKAKSLEETFGFDYCEGDDELLTFLKTKKKGQKYQDPACDLPRVNPNSDLEDPCALEFGTSAGAMGFRKFPNPNFNPEVWNKIGGWKGYTEVKDGMSRLADGSIEPPFRVGISCGSCHIAFNPNNPPKDVLRPTMANLNAAIANQYIRISEVLGSGMPKHSIEWQVFTHARPGTSDTSAVPNDQVNNPGTINAIINFDQRPTFSHDVTTWRKVAKCEKGENCWCHPQKKNSCWERSTKTEKVNHVLKGGEDSIGAYGAVQRVYINIGSCAEQCWVNHLTDLRVLNPHSRNYGQTPFEINQCQKDCSNYRAIEDRVDEIGDFLFSRRPFELYDALASTGVHVTDREDLIDHIEIDRDYGQGAVARGEALFKQQCAKCHSSQGNKNTNFNDVDFFAHKSDKNGKAVLDLSGREIRLDWMGNDDLTPQNEIGTYSCRALHSNHLKGHVYEQYASESYRSKQDVTPGADDNWIDSFGGRGYYRNVSLLSVWAQAPLLHNNAIGPELCGDGKDVDYGFYKSPYPVGSKAPQCWTYDPSVEGRIRLFEASVDELLTPPNKRLKKTTRTDAPIEISMGPKVWESEDHGARKGINMEIPAGTPVALLGSFQHKRFFQDLLKSREEGSLKSHFEKMYGPVRGKEVYEHLMGVDFSNTDNKVKNLDPERLKKTLHMYSSCIAGDENPENGGHDIGTKLNASQKKDLKAFLLTL